MREIKFKAWDKENNKMLIQLEHLSYHLFHINPFGDVYDNGKLRNVILLQYVGLKDKNGKEIYEDDIVEIRYIWCGGTDKEEKASYIETKQIFYNQFNCCFGVYAEKDYDYQMLNSQSMELEVIGNIYENPELLKEND